MRLLFTMLVLMPLGLFVSCSDDDATSTTSESYSSFADKSQNVLPAITDTSAADRVRRDTSRQANSFTWGNVFYEMYVVMGNPNNSDSSNWGVNNIYSLLEQMDDTAAALIDATEDSGREELAAAITDGRFDIFSDMSDVEYPYAIEQASGRWSNRAAWKLGDIFYMRMSSNGSASADSGAENSLAEGQYEEGTGALRLNFLAMVDYEDAAYTGSNQGKFIYRLELNGNDQTNAFEARITKRNTASGSYNIKMAGKGVSQGASSYYLFKVTDNENVTTETFYCVSAEATRDDFEDAMTSSELIKSNTDLNHTDLDNCDAYRTEVSAMSYINYDDTDMPSASASYPDTNFWP